MATMLVWNRNKTNMVVLSKIKEFKIIPNNFDNKYSIRGFFNKENSFLFGDDFETLPIAQQFLTDINRKT